MSWQTEAKSKVKSEWCTSPHAALMHRVRSVRTFWAGGKVRYAVTLMCGNSFTNAIFCNEPADEAVLCDRCLGQPSPRKRWDNSWRPAARAVLGCKLPKEEENG